jgi:hypothetical protein
MAELRTPGGRTGGEPPFDPPRGDEGLDDWFARRLEAQGIKARRMRPPVARILAVVALVGALAALGWVLAGASSKTTAANTTTPPKSSTPAANTGGGSTPTGTTTPKKPEWKKIPITVLNGFDPAQSAAGAARTQLVKVGWHVVGVADASPDTHSTIVVYAPGKLAWAKIVAKRLGLPPPVAIGTAPGVVATQTDAVAIVLGPNLLPNGAGQA